MDENKSEPSKKSNKTLWITLGVIGGVALVLILWYIGTYNSLIKVNEDVNNKWAQVETQYQRRIDLIPNLVNTVKGVANFERGTLEEITRLRSQWQTSSSVNEKVQTTNQLEGALSKLLLVSENYPELKANQNFLALQDELANTENKISVERKRYNDAVLSFNTKIKFFPSNIVAGNLGYTPREYFKSIQGSENPPTVDFG